MREYQKTFLEKAKKLKRGTVALAILGRKLRKNNFVLLVNGQEYNIDVLRCRDRRDVKRLAAKL